VLHERRDKLVESQVVMTTDPSTVMKPAAAPRAGADLRIARERLGLSLDDIAVTLRIRSPHLEALEEGRISLLPGNAYALAFVRTYAGALGLDPEEIVRRFKAEAAAFSQRPKLVFPLPMPEHGLPAGALVLLGLMLAVGAYTGWYRLSGEGRLPAETVTAIPERLAPLTEQALTRQPTATSDVAPQVVLSNPMAPAGPMPPADPAPPAMAFSPTSAAAAQLPPHTAGDAQGAGLTQPAPDMPRILVRANADSWLLVKDRSGTVLLNRVLKAGETWPVPARSDLLMTTGNAGGTEVVVDGATTPILGGNGAVRRDLPLDPNQVKDGKLAAVPVPPVASARTRQ
jgi:cytoskeleton protein RodZ